MVNTYNTIITMYDRRDDGPKPPIKDKFVFIGFIDSVNRSIDRSVGYSILVLQYAFTK